TYVNQFLTSHAEPLSRDRKLRERFPNYSRSEWEANHYVTIREFILNPFQNGAVLIRVPPGNHSRIRTFVRPACLANGSALSSFPDASHSCLGRFPFANREDSGAVPAYGGAV